MGQRPEAGDVADRPQALAGAQVRVDRNAAGVGLDSDGLQADPVDARAPASRDQQSIAAQLAAIAELEDVVVAVAPGGGRMGAEDELDAVAAQDLAERFPEGSRRAGSGSAKLRAGRASTAKVRLSRAGKQRVRRLRRATLVLRIRVTGADRRT